MRSAPAQAFTGKTILVVEDDPISGLVLVDFLQAHGYRLLLARNGPDGLTAADRERPDLVILDVLLPRQNGFEVCFAIRRLPHGANMPVLLMSAVYKDRAHAEEYARKDLGAQGYLVKPFDLEELLSRVRALVGEAA